MAKIKLIKPNVVQIKTDITAKDFTIVASIKPEALKVKEEKKTLFRIGMDKQVFGERAMSFATPEKATDKLVLADIVVPSMNEENLDVFKAVMAGVAAHLTTIESQVKEVLEANEEAVKGIEVE